jgi:hypothetical protein
LVESLSSVFTTRTVSVKWHARLIGATGGKRVDSQF